MNKITIKSLAALALSVALTARAVEGPLNQSASGSTSAQVLFPGGTKPLRVTAYDVTSDLSSSTLKFFSGTANTTVAKAGTSGLTYAVTLKNTWASNDLVLIQTANETVAWNQVSTNTTTTNKQITLNMPLGTNLAVGDTIRKRLTTPYTVLATNAVVANSVFISTTNGLTTTETVVTRSAGAWSKGTVSTINCVTNQSIPLRGVVEQNTPAGKVVYEQLTNYCTLLASVQGIDSAMHVDRTNGFAAGDLTIIESTNGTVLTTFLIDTISTTNMTAVSMPTAPVGSRVWKVSGTTYTTKYPAVAGERALVLSSSNSLATDDILVVAYATSQFWRQRVGGLASEYPVNTMTLSSSLGAAMVANQVYYKLTNTHTLALVATNTDTTCVVDVATNLSAADALIVLPASGGVFANDLLGTGTDYATTMLGFTGAVGVALAPGDAIFYVGTTNSTPVGATTLRQSGVNLYSADAGRPVRAVITGTSACSINSMQVDYGR